jgi:sulfite oxidase
LLGHRWKEYHLALGPNLNKIHEESWKIFKEEKRENMLVVLDFPMNCEPKRSDLLKSHITPNDIHFVRNHGGVPTVSDVNKYSIAIGGLVKNPGELLFNDLKDPDKFEQVEMTITLQCSGTRRIEQINLYPGEGDGMYWRFCVQEVAVSLADACVCTYS